VIRGSPYRGCRYDVLCGREAAMKGNAKVIAKLNARLAEELAATN
jgi:hypothetical protein